MGKILLLFSVLTTTLTRGQVRLDKFDEIVIVDYQIINSKQFYGRTYSIKQNQPPVELFDLNILTGMELLAQLKNTDYEKWEKINSILANKDEDSILVSTEKYIDEIKKLKNEYRPIPVKIKNVNTVLLESLQNEMLKDVNRGQILEELGLTKDSIQKSLKVYLLKYLDIWKIEYKQKNLKYCTSILSDFDKFNEVAILMTQFRATEDYPTVLIEFRNQTDTLKLYSKGQFGFMLPWIDKDGRTYSYNPNLSKAIGELIPDYKYSNKRRLLGQESVWGDYLTDLYFNTIEQYCIDKKNRLIKR